MPGLFESTGVRETQILQLPSGDVIDPTVDMPNGNGVYGYQDKGHPRPELLAPRNEDTGGFLFLPTDVSPESIDMLVALAGMASTEHRRRTMYGVQAIDAPEGMEARLGYLRKLVIADRFALRFLYRSLEEGDYDSFSEQPLDIAELVKAFIEDEKAKHGTYFTSPTLNGKFGGDGNFAREQLSFGFAIENSYHGVISVWSRAWLVTK